MKKIHIGFIAVLTILFVTFGCNRDVALEISEAKSIGHGFIQTGSESDYGPYASWVETGENMRGLQGLKFLGNDLDSRNQVLFFGGSLPNISNSTNFVNGRHGVDQLRTRSMDQKIGIFESDFEGQDVDYNFSGNPSYSVSLYCPERFNIDMASSFPKDVKSSTWHEISRNGEIHFNRDPKNENGIFVTLTYRGISTDPTFEEIASKGEDASQLDRIAYYPEDIGAIKLSSSLFDGIPKHGVAFLTIYRGTSWKQPDGNNYILVRNNVQRGIDLALID